MHSLVYALTQPWAEILGNKWVRQRHNASGTFSDEAIRILSLFVALQAVKKSVAIARPVWGSLQHLFLNGIGTLEVVQPLGSAASAFA